MRRFVVHDHLDLAGATRSRELRHVLGAEVELSAVVVVTPAVEGNVLDRRLASPRERLAVMELQLVRRTAPLPGAPEERAASAVALPDLLAHLDRDVPRWFRSGTRLGRFRARVGGGKFRSGTSLDGQRFRSGTCLGGQRFRSGTRLRGGRGALATDATLVLGAGLEGAAEALAQHIFEATAGD